MFLPKPYPISLAVALLICGAARADDLALKRVLLSSGGLGYYEYEASVEGDATVELKAPLDQIDDILKSLVVFDDKGGVGGLDLPSREPLAETFRDLPFSADDLLSTPTLLAALRGAVVEVEGARALSGRVVSVVEEPHESPEGRPLSPRHRVTLMTEKGLEPFVLEDSDSVKFTDPTVRAQLDKALTALAANGEKDSRLLRLSSKGKDKRTLRVAYIIAAPLWKASYRLVLPQDADAKQAKLQGWATLENLSGQDWKDVDLTLVSGQPVTFRQELYRTYMVERPNAPVEVVGRLLPGIDQGEMADAAADLPTKKGAPPHAMAAMAPAPPSAAMAASRSAPLSMAAAPATVAAEEGLTQVSFHLPFPVSVANGRTLSLPIIDAAEPAERLAVFDPSVERNHPLSSVRLTNDGKSGLPPGIVTIYDEGAGGVEYVGDSRLSDLPVGDQRLLSYALDQKTLVETSNADSAVLTRGTLAKGMLTVETLNRNKTTYRVKANEARRLLVVAPALDGWKLTEPATAPAQSQGRYRLPFEVKPGAPQDFAITQERTDARVVALASADDNALGFYMRARELDAATHDQLAKLADLRGKQSAAERALTEAGAQIDEVVKDQARLKDMLAAVSAGSDLQKRYLTKLDQDETQLEALKATRATRQKARDAAKQAVEDFLSGA